MDPRTPDDDPTPAGRDESLALRLEQHLEALRQGRLSDLATEADPELARLGPVVERLHQFAGRLDAPSTADISMAGTGSTAPPIPSDLPLALTASSGAPPATLPVAAQFVGKFRVVRPLGQGGQASTLLAFDPDLKRHVVLKLYHNARTPAEQETVLREGQALARVRSPYVAQCYSAEREDGVPYLVVEYVPGRSLAQRLQTGGLPAAQIPTLIRQLAEGLAAVHAGGLLHRDVKPGNILIGDDGLPRLVDFGLAVHVASDSMSGVSGTLAYMAPEQARGEAERIDARTDLFGLGAVLYELLTGRPPYQATDRAQLLLLARAGVVIPPAKVKPKVPPALNDLCLRCLAREPADRVRTARQLADAAARLERPRRRWVAGVAAAAVLLLGVGIAWGLLNRGGGEELPADPPLRVVKGPAPVVPAPVENLLPPRPAVPPPPPPRYHPTSKRLLRNDFALRVEISTNDPERPWVTVPHGHVHKITQGEYVRFRVSAPHNCYVGIWDVTPDRIVCLFPNQFETDNLVRAGLGPRLVPDPDQWKGVRASKPSGFEYVQIFAATRAWQGIPPTLRTRGPGLDVFSTPQDVARCLQMLEQTPVRTRNFDVDDVGDLVSEAVIRLEIVPPPENVDAPK